VAKCSSLPEDLIRQVSGQVVYEEEGPRIPPLNTFADPTINLASAQLVLNHNHQWPDQRILAQVTLNFSTFQFTFIGIWNFTIFYYSGRMDRDNKSEWCPSLRFTTLGKDGRVNSSSTATSTKSTRPTTPKLAAGAAPFCNDTRNETHKQISLFSFLLFHF
jgi:hypothetical protein